MCDLITNKAGYERVKTRLDVALKRYHEVCSTNAEAAGAGDSSVWHDNFAYEENQREMHKWARRINDLKVLLSRLRVVNTPQSPDKVQVGCAVVLRDDNEDKEWCFEVAGYDDSAPEQKRISYTSPLMHEIFGGKIGDVHEVYLDGKNREVTIKSIVCAEKNNER